MYDGIYDGYKQMLSHLVGSVIGNENEAKVLAEEIVSSKRSAPVYPTMFGKW